MQQQQRQQIYLQEEQNEFCVVCLVHVYNVWMYTEDVPLVEFMYLVFTRMPGESYHMRLRSLVLRSFDVCQALTNSLIWYITCIIYNVSRV